MGKCLELLKKYKISVIIAVTIVVVALVLLFLFRGTKIKNYSNEYYSFLYDSTWHIKKAKENKLSLSHKSGSTIKAEIIDLTEDYKYSTIEDILDEFLYSVEKQNEEYNLIAKQEQKMTKSEYDGFKALYENGKNQALVYVFKKGDKVAIINFEADNSYFDILLDSVQNIVYNFKLTEKVYEIPDNLKVESTKINFKDNDLLTNLDTDVLSIASKNYYVEFSVPKGFEASEIRSDGGGYYYTVKDNNKISLFSSMFSSNIYNYLDKDETFGTLYTQIPENIKNGTDQDYSNFEESIEEINGDYPGYIYRATYTYKGVYSESEKEKIIMIFAIDKNHTLQLILESSDMPFTREFIEKIKVLNATNYSSYVKREIVDGNIVSTMKKYTDYNKNKVIEAKLKMPESYTEIGKDYNIYERRFFNKGYNEDTDVWDYEVSYYLTSNNSNIDSLLNLSNLNYKSQATEYEYESDVNLNGKNFKVYRGSYIDTTNTIFEKEQFSGNSKILFYETDNGNYLVVEVFGNGVEISNEILNEVTNFDIETKDI